MARYSERDRSHVDAAVQRWRDDCLFEDGSLFFTGEQIWTYDHAQELVTQFNENELTDKRSFEEKLAEQLDPVSERAKVLMAEVIAVYFFFASSVGGPRKRELVSFVLALAERELPEDKLATRAFGFGIGGPGQAFNSRRPYLLQYLISFAARLKNVDEDERREVLADPWGFRDWLVGEDDSADGGEQMMRQLLLHLLFPEEFERIASGPHKYRIADTFDELLDDQWGDAEDVDHRLLKIRERIRELMPEGQPQIGGAIDYYYSPLVEAWNPTEDDPEDDGGGISNLGALEQKRQVVLYGPPGTGKTHEAKDLARRLLRHQALVRWKAAPFLRNRQLIEDVADHQIRRLQLHQNYSYEDFVWGLRLGAGGATVPHDGYLLKLIREIKDGPEPGEGLLRLPWVLILDEMNRVDLSRLLGEVFSTLEDRDDEVDLPMLTEGGERRSLSLPSDLYLIGTLNLIDQSVEQIDFALRRRFLWLESGFNNEVIAKVVRERWEALDISGHHDWERLRPDIEDLSEQAELLNEHIRDSPLLGPQYEIGHTYFFDVVGLIRAWPRVRLKGRRPSGYLWRRSDGRPMPPVLDLWRHSLRPLLEQYLVGIEPQAARVELNRLRGVFLHGELE
jgi:5-methylcytosine-specific restriction protein B